MAIQSEDPEGAIMKHNTQDTVKRTIFSEIHKKHYTLTAEAPICNREFFKDFGYTANTPASRAVSDGTYVPPPGSDSATKDLFLEIAPICCIVPVNSGSFVITPEQWKQYWQFVNKETSSLESGIHFGHYIVGCTSDIISHYHVNPVTVTLAHAIQLKR